MNCLQLWKDRGTLVEAAWESRDAFVRADSLLGLHSATTLPGAIDILHVASAQILNADLFLTCDDRQYKLAMLAGLKAKLIGARD